MKAEEHISIKIEANSYIILPSLHDQTIHHSLQAAIGWTGLISSPKKITTVCEFAFVAFVAFEPASNNETIHHSIKLSLSPLSLPPSLHFYVEPYEETPESATERVPLRRLLPGGKQGEAPRRLAKRERKPR